MDKEKLRQRLTLRKVLKFFYYPTKNVTNLGCKEYLLSPPWANLDLQILKFDDNRQIFLNLVTGEGGDVFWFIARTAGIPCETDEQMKDLLKLATKIAYYTDTRGARFFRKVRR